MWTCYTFTEDSHNTSARQMCLFCSLSKASPSWKRLFLTLSSLVAIAEPILSNMFRISLYCFLFLPNLNSGSESFGFSCFECLAASRFFLIFFNSILYCFYCSSNSFAQLGVPVLSALAHELSQRYRASSCEIACIPLGLHDAVQDVWELVNLYQNVLCLLALGCNK